MEKTYLIDTHAHIDMLDNIDSALNSAKENNVKKIILPCAYPKDIENIYQITQNYDKILGKLDNKDKQLLVWVGLVWCG